MISDTVHSELMQQRARLLQYVHALDVVLGIPADLLPVPADIFENTEQNVGYCNSSGIVTDWKQALPTINMYADGINALAPLEIKEPIVLPPLPAVAGAATVKTPEPAIKPPPPPVPAKESEPAPAAPQPRPQVCSFKEWLIRELPVFKGQAFGVDGVERLVRTLNGPTTMRATIGNTLRLLVAGKVLRIVKSGMQGRGGGAVYRFFDDPGPDARQQLAAAQETRPRYGQLPAGTGSNTVTGVRRSSKEEDGNG